MRTGAVRSNFMLSATRIELTRVLHDRLRDLNLAIVEIEQRAILVDGRGADHGVVDLELADEVDGRLANDAAIGCAHHAAGDDDLDLGRAACRMVTTLMLLVMTSSPSRCAQRLRHLLRSWCRC